MYLSITVLCFLFIALVGVWVGFQAGRSHTPNDHVPEYAGTLVIYTVVQDDESYLFLDTEMAPAELASHKEVLFKVETQNPQIPL